MARPPSELQALLAGLDGVNGAYFSPPTSGMQYPCIKIDPGIRNRAFSADNIKYLFKKGYTITVIDPNPLSLIPDQVEMLPDSSYDRFYRVNGLSHFVFQLFF